MVRGREKYVKGANYENQKHKLLAYGIGVFYYETYLF
jgi:hypothetical protein